MISEVTTQTEKAEEGWSESISQVTALNTDISVLPRCSSKESKSLLAAILKRLGLIVPPDGLRAHSLPQRSACNEHRAR